MMGMVNRCPGCGAADRRVYASGLGGRWKFLCASCGYRYDESDGDRAPGPEPGKIIDEDRG